MSQDAALAAHRPTMECQTCGREAPAGNFCGYCGDFHEEPRHGGPKWLRARAFTAAPGEHLLTPDIVSTLFPQLSPRSRRAFLYGLAVLLVALLATALSRFPAALVAVAALGMPFLFLIYLQQADTHRDIPTKTLVITSALGIGLGVGWVLLTGAEMARSHGVALGTGIVAYRLVRDGLGVPLGSLLLMLLPAAVVRLWRSGIREPLDGFAIGALGALVFTAASTFTRLAPQFDDGMVARNRPMNGILIEAGIRGIAIPVTAACVGGLIGIALWFRRPPERRDRHRHIVRFTLVLMGVVIIALYAAVGLIDVAMVPQWIQLTVHLAIAAIALLALRIGLQLTLLHEDYDPPDQDHPLLCWQCGHVVPDLPFCGYCGAATRASSRASRVLRRDHRPVPVAFGEPEPAAIAPGHLYFAGDYALPDAPAKTSRRRLVLVWVAATGLVAAGLVALSGALAPSNARYSCPPNCGPPPIGQPVTVNPVFTAPDESFSVSYPADHTPYQVSFEDDGVTADLTKDDGGTIRLFSTPANGRTPQQIATDLLRESFPDYVPAYELPNTTVGYQPGYGLAADWWPQSAAASYSQMRILVMVAVKDDLALVAGGIGPYHAFSPDFGPGRPSAAGVQVALDMGRYVNSFEWAGDPPR